MAETLRWWRNPRIAACDAAMSRFASGAVITPGARIEWVGAERDLPGEYRPEESHDLRGAWVTPGLIDCHTHLVFAGNRAAEYAERLRGRSYQEIARAGGGDHACGEDRLRAAALRREPAAAPGTACGRGHHGRGQVRTTDCNPGSAPGSSLLLAMSMATRLFGLTCEEALAAVTRHAARALGMEEERGCLTAGKAADFVVWTVAEPEELEYWSGFNPRRSVIKAGRRVC